MDYVLSQFMVVCYDYPFILNYNLEANVNQVSAEDFSDPCQYDFGRRSSIQVCIDPLAENYFPMADVNSNIFNSFCSFKCLS